MENNGPYEVLGDTSSSQAANPERRKTLLVYALCLCYLILGIAVLVIGIAAINDSSLIFRSSSGKNSPAKYSIVPAQKACAAQATLGYAPFYPSAGLPNSASTNSSYGGRQSDGLSKLFLNATLISMDPNMPFVSPGIDFLIDGEGAFFQIGPNMQATADDLIDLKGAYVTPGLIDMHSHTGVYAYPEDSFGTADGNEMTKPSLSQIRALDAFDASDPAIPLARAGGLTTVLVLPGSGDVMGGQAQAFKYRATEQPKQMFFEGARRGAKFACGENPKRVFGSKGVLPMSRMGIGWELRSRFFEAAAMTQKQDQWDCQNASKNQVLEPRPFALELETLQGILSGDVDLHNHCYEVQDLQMMMRTAAEFGFQIRCFHHGLEAWKIADEVAAAGIGVATFADHWGFKLEGYDGSVYGPKILVDAGVKMAIKTDHPVIPAWELMHEAAKTTFYGLTDEQAMASITTTPASLIGATRIGSIQERDPDDPDDPGFDADFVVWDRYPLELGARPTQVWVDGVRVVNNPLPLVPKQSTAQATLDLTGLCSAATANQKQTDVACYYVEGADVYTMVDGSDEPSNGTVVVVNGIVNCIGCTPPEGCSQVSFPGGVVIPGLVIVGSHIGLVDVPSESTSQDGTVSDLDQRFVRAIDGVRLNNYYARHLEAAFKANVLTHVVQPQSSVVVMGQTGAYSTSGTVITDATLAESVSLDITIGQAAKAGGLSNSISSQIAQLRKIFSAAKQVLATNGTYDATDPIYQALQGELPIVLHSDNADEIATFIKLKQQFAFNLVLYGGAESFLVADLLASENVPVVLSPVRQAPSTFSVWNTASSLAATLEAAGVEVSIATDVMDKVRNIAWDAGIERAHGFNSGLKSITINPARAFGLDSQGVGLIQVGQPARFGAYTADPLTLFGHVQFVALGTTVICQPKQY